MTFANEKDRIRGAARLLYEASRPLRVLRALTWPPEVKEEFLAAGGRAMPRPVDYPVFDPGPSLEAVGEVRRRIAGSGPIDLWLGRHAEAIELGARMLAAVGTPEFFEHGRRVYGEPSAPLRHAPVTPLDLARAVHESIDQLARVHIDTAPPSRHPAEEIAAGLEREVRAHFGDQAPAVVLVDRLSANALASPREIKVRRGASFTDRDFVQLLHHEAYIHVGTSLNGKAQDDLPILAAGHPGTTRTQEGLAVFAEVISGGIELDRLRRLADRVVAIQMAVEGADFLEVYRFFLERTGNPEQAFENARRVFRGGVVTGGAPFTKDVTYLMGLLQVNNFVRAAFAAGRADCLLLLFCGKLDLADIPALCELSAMGLCRPPRFVPPWVSDPRYLLAILTFTSFTSRVDLAPLVAAARELLDDAPVVRVPGAGGRRG